MGAHLVSIDSEAENDFVNGFGGCQTIWTGLVASTWNSDVKFHWFNGDPATYSPNVVPANAYYYCTVSVSSTSGPGSWTTDVCAGYYPFVCKKAARSTVADKVRSAGSLGRWGLLKDDEGCKPGWKRFNSSCYWASTMDNTTTPLDYFAAQLACQDKGSQLASIHSSLENAFVGSLVTCTLTCYKTCTLVWLGVENTDPSCVRNNACWSWVDRSVMDFQAWQGTYPQTSDASYQCGVYNNVGWTNEQCGNLHHYVCKMPAV
jgi:hypothetical protein